MIKEMTYKDYIEQNGMLVYSPVGISMLPLIREKLDSVKLVKINRGIKKYDVLLYRRENGQYVLHRVIKVYHDSYDMMGDNQWSIEKNIKKNQVVALMQGVYRGERFININSLKYKLYARIRVWFRFFRKLNNYIKVRIFKK